MKKLAGITLLAVLISSLLVPTVVSAQGLDLNPHKDDRVIFGGSFRLGMGEVITGDLLSFGGQVDLDEGSLVEGTFVSMGGSANVSGTIAQDLVAFGADIALQATALVNGDLAMIGATLDRELGAQILGDVVSESVPLNLDFPGIPAINIGEDGFKFNFGEFNFGAPSDDDGPVINAPDFEFQRESLTRSVGRHVRGGLFNSFAMAAIAVILALFLAEPTKRVSRATLNEPIAAGGISLISIVVVPILAVLLSITIILIPVVILLALVVVIAIIFGWVAIGWEVGERLMRSLNLDWADPLVAGTGTFVLTFAAAMLNLIPCLGIITGLLLMLISTGGVLLSRFGTRDYPEVEDVKIIPAKQSTAKKSVVKKTPSKKRPAKKKSPAKKSPPKKRS